MSLSKEEWADRETLTFGAFLDDLDIMDGFPQNEFLALEIIKKLRSMYNLLDF